LKTREGDLLPPNPEGEECEFDTLGAIGGCSIAGDIRADENIALHSMHTIWVREHNFVATKLAQRHPEWEEEKLFQESRKIVIAEWQNVVFNEWLPNVITLPQYKAYNPRLDARIINAFTAVAFRFGHSLVPNQFTQLNNKYTKEHEAVSLRESFFNIRSINTRGVEPTVFGLVGNQSNTIDAKFAFNLVRKLFIRPGESGHMDLTAFNIQRARDHGIPTYGKWRSFCKLPAVSNFHELKKYIPAVVVDRLSKLYNNPNDIDLFAAGISENHSSESIIGPTFQCIFKAQFLRLRDGDRYYFENPGIFTPAQINQIKRVSLARVLCNNAKGIVSINQNALFQTKKKRTLCDDIPGINFDDF